MELSFAVGGEDVGPNIDQTHCSFKSNGGQDATIPA
jgi:hypothetical protein